MDIHQKVGVVSHAQVCAAIAETASRQVVGRCDGANACPVLKESTYPWAFHDMDETVLKSRLFRELSLDFGSPRIVLESKITDGALWHGTDAK